MVNAHRRAGAARPTDPVKKNLEKKKSAAARPKARAGSAAALARARKSPKAG
jgi:hypothetical protein